MRRKLQKIGNSYMVSIPAQFIRDAGWKEGQYVAMSMEDKQLSLKAEKIGRKNISEIKTGVLNIPNFDFEQVLRWTKEGAYED